MPNDAVVTWTGNATQMLAEYKKMEDARKREVEDLRKAKDAQNEVARSERANASEIARLREQALTPQQKYNREVQRANELLKAGKITQSEFNVELQKQNQLLNQGATNVSSIAREAVGAFTGISSVLSGAMVVLSAIKSEYEDLVRRQKDTAISQLNFAQVARGTGIGFKADDTMGVADIEPAIKGLSQRTSASPDVASRAFAAALAGRGSGSNAQALAMAEQALRVDRNDEDLTRELATRGGLLSTAAGFQDPRQALALFADLQNTAAVVKPRDVGQSGMAAVTDLLTFGASPEQGAELFATVNNLMNDTEGARSHQASVSLALQMRDFAPGKKDRVPKDQLAALKAARTPDEKIAVMQRSPELRAAFLDSASFETKATPAIEQLLSGSDVGMSALATARAGIRAPTTAAFEDFVGGINSMPSQQPASIMADWAAFREGKKLGDTAGGQAGNAQTIFEETLNDIDMRGPNAWARQFATNAIQSKIAPGVGKNYAQAAIEVLQSPGVNAGLTAQDSGQVQKAISLLQQIATQTAGPAPEAALGKK